MSRAARTAFLWLNQALYGCARMLIFRSSAQTAHDRTMNLLRWADQQRRLQPLLGMVHSLAFEPQPVVVGGVRLDYPLILAAGLVKGDGFESEVAAMDTVRRGANIMPGWRTMPRLAGLVEFGSFTRWPRVGNPGTVVWRDVASRSTQNRIGLRNPGAKAAAAFLAAREKWLPAQFGINIAVSPAVDDPDQQTEEVVESLDAFLMAGVRPTWVTLNLSCPNTEDDPNANQTTDLAQQVCGAVVERTGGRPLWVKVGPMLSDEQYRVLMRAFAEIGVRAVIATNTLPAPAPGSPQMVAGIGGGQLHCRAVEVAALLMWEKSSRGYTVDVIGCGGVQDGRTCRDFADFGVRVVQCWTALIYRGPLAAALIAHEAGI